MVERLFRGYNRNVFIVMVCIGLTMSSYPSVCQEFDPESDEAHLNSNKRRDIGMYLKLYTLNLANVLSTIEPGIELKVGPFSLTASYGVWTRMQMGNDFEEKIFEGRRYKFGASYFFPRPNFPVFQDASFINIFYFVREFEGEKWNSLYNDLTLREAFSFDHARYHFHVHGWAIQYGHHYYIMKSRRLAFEFLFGLGIRFLDSRYSDISGKEAYDHYPWRKPFTFTQNYTVNGEKIGLHIALNVGFIYKVF